MAALKVLALAILCCATNARAQSGPMADWRRCLVNSALAIDSPQEPATVVAQAAFGMCLSEERNFRIENQNNAVRLGLSRFDPGVEQIFLEQRASFREQIIAEILKARRQNR